MKKKLLTAVLSIIFVSFVLLVIYSIYLGAAECTSGTGDKCKGECCVANPYWCVAGPCDKLFF